MQRPYASNFMNISIVYEPSKFDWSRANADFVALVIQKNKNVIG